MADTSTLLVKENKNYFGKLTKRMNDFRENVLESKPYVDAERAIYATESYKKNQDKPVALKRAYMLKNILENMTIYIEDETLIVGNQAKANGSAPIFPEYAMDWVVNELDEFEKRDGDVFYITEETKEQLREIEPFWEHNTTKEKGLAAIPEKSRIFYDLGIIKAEGNITSGDAHIAVEYEKVIKEGLKSYEKYTKDMLAKMNLTNVEDMEKSYFYEAVLIVIEAIRNFAKRYSDLAAKMAETGKDPKRLKELKEIARVMNKVPYESADSYYESLQSIWLVHLVLQIESNGHSLSYGRMDQYLYSYYKNDLEKGLINEDEACELLTNLWIKTLTINKIRS